jgi:hypothetical protein
MWHGVDQVFHFASVNRSHNYLSVGEMAIQGADADAGTSCDFFQAHIQPNFRERYLGGVDQ